MRDIRLGGLTPSLPLVRAIAAEVSLPIRVMVRENAGYGTDASELVRLCRSAGRFASAGVDGLVVGFARNGQLLLDELREVLNAAGALPATFHRAFDSLADPMRAIDVLAGVAQIDRILTDGLAAGGKRPPQACGDAHDRCVRLEEYSDRAGPRITIIAGSGVDEAMLAAMARTRCVREVHVGRAARERGEQEGPVAAARVRRLRELID